MDDISQKAKELQNLLQNNSEKINEVFKPFHFD